MAKVMISIPDEDLKRIDAAAKRRKTSRSRWLRELAIRDLELDERARQFERTMTRIDRRAERMGGRSAGDSVDVIRADRDSH